MPALTFVQPLQAHVAAGLVPLRVAVRIENGGNGGFELTPDGTGFSGAVRVAPGRVGIYARFPGAEAYQGLAELKVVQ